VFVDVRLTLPLIISAATSALTSASPVAISMTQRNPSTNDRSRGFSAALISLLRPGFLLPPVYSAAQLAFVALRGSQVSLNAGQAIIKNTTTTILKPQREESAAGKQHC